MITMPIQANDVLTAKEVALLLRLGLLEQSGVTPDGKVKTYTLTHAGRVLTGDFGKSPSSSPRLVRSNVT